MLLSMAYVVQAAASAQPGEARLAFAFLGLESLVNAIGENEGSSDILTEDEFEPFSKYVRSTIKEYAKAKNWTEDRRKALYEKLGETCVPQLLHA